MGINAFYTGQITENGTKKQPQTNLKIFKKNTGKQLIYNNKTSPNRHRQVHGWGWT